jgi:N-methylhydantoinase B
MAVLTPIFYRAEWVGFAASMAHKSDIGGTVPGSGSGQAREIYQEGLHLPPVKYVSQFKPVKEVEAIIGANSRTPELVVGDIRGQAGANRVGEKRLGELFERYGKETVLSSMGLLSQYTESRVRKAIASWPDGSSEAESFVDHDGIELTRPIRIHVAVHKKGDEFHFDFSRTSDQTKGPANIRPPLVRACCSYALVCLVDPYLPINQGLTKVISTTFREGSVVNPRFPAAVNTYMPTAHAVVESIFNALGRFVSGKRVAGGSGSSAIALGGRSTRSQRSYVHYEILTGGTGARWGRDGVSATAFHLSNCKTAPVEIVESEFPVQVERFELIPDSGGPGNWRGGLGFTREYRILEDETRFSLRTDKHQISPWGSEEGKSGRTGACLINPRTSREQALPSRFGDFALKEGDVVRIERPGGGGIGHPHGRDAQKVLEDVVQGYVSRDSAERDYGVAVEDTPTGPSVNWAKTMDLRKDFTAKN